MENVIQAAIRRVPGGSSATTADAAILRAGETLLKMQTADGALPVGDPRLEKAERQVTPYFAHFGAWGLILAFRVARDPRFLTGARRWVEWNDAHRNPDATVFDYRGRSGAWISLKDYDSTDSYASTYLELLDAFARAPLPDTERRWLQTRHPLARRTVEAMLLTQQKNGLTLAKPTYPVMYTMDNTEVLRGLIAGERFLKSGGAEDKRAAALCSETAKRVALAIGRDLWDSKNICYLVGLQTDGGRMDGLKTWYPDVMANLMAVGWLPDSVPSAVRHRALYQRLAAMFAGTREAGIPPSVSGEGDLERLIWWGYAARGSGDSGRLNQIRALLMDVNAKVDKEVTLTNPATLGHLCRLLSTES